MLVRCKLLEVEAGNCVHLTHPSEQGEGEKLVCHSSSDKARGLQNARPRSWRRLLDTHVSTSTGHAARRGL